MTLPVQEGAATRLRYFLPAIPTGLIQTPEYMRHVMTRTSASVVGDIEQTIARKLETAGRTQPARANAAVIHPLARRYSRPPGSSEVGASGASVKSALRASASPIALRFTLCTRPSTAGICPAGRPRGGAAGNGGEWCRTVAGLRARGEGAGRRGFPGQRRL
ncbi:Scr1 family TA system antitoxin-like transcriptional regulator [Streptomyces violarus]|uniref:Scr1 family TA system antitoxin-like transcriptional regulator n=2 Tax=Streptomyces TaxID=1883 RepID=UPI002D806622|nr:Scr1 family TA system antitoxin-like transcriptional regulator [Streptomyces violarus]